MPPPRNRKHIPGAAFTTGTLARMTLHQLQRECELRSLSKKGDKAHLIARLTPHTGRRADHPSQQQSPPGSPRATKPKKTKKTTKKTKPPETDDDVDDTTDLRDALDDDNPMAFKGPDVSDEDIWEEDVHRTTSDRRQRVGADSSDDTRPSTHDERRRRLEPRRLDWDDGQSVSADRHTAKNEYSRETVRAHSLPRSRDLRDWHRSMDVIRRQEKAEEREALFDAMHPLPDRVSRSARATSRESRWGRSSPRDEGAFEFWEAQERLRRRTAAAPSPPRVAPRRFGTKASPPRPVPEPDFAGRRSPRRYSRSPESSPARSISPEFPSMQEDRGRFWAPPSTRQGRSISPDRVSLKFANNPREFGGRVRDSLRESHGNII